MRIFQIFLIDFVFVYQIKNVCTKLTSSFRINVEFLLLAHSSKNESLLTSWSVDWLALAPEDAGDNDDDEDDDCMLFELLLSPVLR